MLEKYLYRFTLILIAISGLLVGGALLEAAQKKTLIQPSEWPAMNPILQSPTPKTRNCQTK